MLLLILILYFKNFNFTLYYNLLLCFIQLEMHVRLICAIKFYLLTYSGAGTCSVHPSPRPVSWADATNSTQHVRHAAPMLAVATVSVATCSDIYACPYKSKDTLWYKLLLKYNNMYKNAVIRQIIVNLRQNYTFLNKIPQTPSKYPVSHGNRSGSINSTG